jgi:uncharacterized membrane protein
MFSDLDEGKILKAIHQVEAHTSGEIVIHVCEKASEDILKSAKNFFRQKRLYHSRYHNNVLIFIAKQNRALAIYADHGIHQLVEPAYWHELVRALQEAFKQKEYVAGLITCIEQIGKLLEKHFPETSGDKGLQEKNIV